MSQLELEVKEEKEDRADKARNENRAKDTDQLDIKRRTSGALTTRPAEVERERAFE